MQSVPITTNVVRGVLDKTLCDKDCQRLTASRWFSPISSTNNTDRNDIAESGVKHHTQKKMFYSLVRTTLLPPKKLSVRLCFLNFFQITAKYIFTASPPCFIP